MAEKRVALVTGGAKRVGRAIVEKLAAGGFEVAFTYLSSAAEAEELAPRIGGTAIRADLTKLEEAVAAIRRAVAGRLDVLVNNASLYEPSSLEKTNPEQMRRMMAIHYESPLLLAKAFATSLRAARGHVVNMVDLLAERPWPQFLAYCASKEIGRASCREGAL